MKKIILCLMLLLLSNSVFALNYKVSIIFEEKGNLIFDYNTNIIVENKTTFVDSNEYRNQNIKTVERYCVENKRNKFCKETINVNNEKEKNFINMYILIDEYNKNKSLSIKFNYDKYIDQKEKNIEETQAYSVGKTLDLKEQETIIGKLENKQLKVIIKEIK